MIASLLRSSSACALSAAFLSLAFVTPSAAQQATAAEDLPELSVTANRVEGPQAAIGSAVSSLSGEELEKRQIRVVSDVLREMPGVAVSRTGPVGALTQIRIRGSEGNQTLVLIDGIEMNDPGASGEFDFANLLALEVERVDVLRGPQSALYGSDAAGGVVNIVTRKGDGKPAFRGQVEGGSFGTLNGSAAVSGGTEAYDYLFATQMFHTDGNSVARKRDAWNSGFRDRDGYESGSALAKVSVRPSEMFEISSVARYTSFRADRDNFGSATGFPYAAAVESGDYERGKQFFGRVQGKATLLDGAWDHVLGLSYTNQDRRNYDGTDQRSSATVGETVKLDYQTNYRFSTEGGLPATHVLTFGADTQRDHVVSKSIWLSSYGYEPVRKSITNTGLVGQYQLGLFENLFVTGSVRHDFNERFKDETTYRLASAYTFDRTQTKIRASFGTGVKNPTVSELYGFYGNYVGNSALTPEKTRGWDIGFDQPFWDDRVTFEATYFQQRVSDLISSRSYQDTAGNYVTTPVNLDGTSRIKGVELGVTLRPIEGLSIRAAYTYSDGEDPAGAELVRRPRNIGSLNVNYAFLENRANVNLGVVHNGKQKDYAYDAMTYAQTRVPLKAYTLVNLGASYKVHPNAEVYGRIENLFDKRYEEVFTYNTPGRAAYGGVKVSF
ncbi:TonB-dependent receptor [Methylopila jiangsuensis]|uniref:TonB-dependent receptor n=1 Tax=Methylopila jiangsuensis TaxID=586230 RepID=A0A9W6JHB0_9HYPH|nr:TonB-dependent receptor [Methylopila jiangsuensis]MDR6285761.1 vitamin B12 transporter [Methylopila jiangsuensis]GLK75518.1 TonB-dependent receptor [Methylopila jiangsuensis]